MHAVLLTLVSLTTRASVVIGGGEGIDGSMRGQLQGDVAGHVQVASGAVAPSLRISAGWLEHTEFVLP